VRHDHRATAVTVAPGSNRSRGLRHASNRPESALSESRLGGGRLGCLGVRELKPIIDSSRQLSTALENFHFSRRFLDFFSIRLDVFSTALDISRQNSLFLDVFSKIKSIVESALDPETAQA